MFLTYNGYIVEETRDNTTAVEQVKAELISCKQTDQALDEGLTVSGNSSEPITCEASRKCSSVDEPQLSEKHIGATCISGPTVLDDLAIDKMKETQLMDEAFPKVLGSQRGQETAQEAAQDKREILEKSIYSDPFVAGETNSTRSDSGSIDTGTKAFDIVCQHLCEHLVADVKAGVREEMSAVLLAVESLQSQMVEKLSCIESKPMSSKSMSNQRSGVELSNEVVEPDLESCVDKTQNSFLDFDDLILDGRKVSPRLPTVSECAMQLIGSDLRVSLLSARQGFYQPLAGTDAPEIYQDKLVESFKNDIQQLQDKYDEITKDYQSWEALWRSRNDIFEKEIVEILKKKDALENKLNELLEPEQPRSARPGPQSLSWIEGNIFGNACMLVIALNLVMMMLHDRYPNLVAFFFACDQFFLVWYVMEILLKFFYYRGTLLFGNIYVVWWNWLDLSIVISGVIDQWLLQLWACMSNNPHDANNFSFLRLLRLFRILRALRFLRMVFTSDMNWVDGDAFRCMMLSVISANSIVMSLELDIKWGGWRWVEHIFLIVYAFELMVRLKRMGLKFFAISPEAVWNYLDFVMVVGGMFDLWFLPLILLVQSLLLGESLEEPYFINKARIFLKLMRLVRVLRLVRLAREVKPLYNLLAGVWDSFKAMQYVLVLTLLVLYACAIVFTDLVGKGFMYTDGNVPSGAVEFFGSVGVSMFSLFRVMNGDASVAAPITEYVVGQLLFVSFMVGANWCILAILTSVVSDHMISTSTRQTKEDEDQKKECEFRQRTIRLKEVFKRIDADESGYINEKEWENMMEDKTVFQELTNASALDSKDLHDFFRYLSEDAESVSHRYSLVANPGFIQERLNSGRCINYSIFIQSLRDEKEYATKRSILHLLAHFRHIQEKLHEIDCFLHKGRHIDRKSSFGSSQWISAQEP